MVTELIMKDINENARIAQDQSEYNKHHGSLVERYETAKSRLDGIAEEKQSRIIKRDMITKFITDIKRRDGLLDEFDEELWYELAESVTAYSETEFKVTFKDSSEICVNGL